LNRIGCGQIIGSVGGSPLELAHDRQGRRHRIEALLDRRRVIEKNLPDALKRRQRAPGGKPIAQAPLKSQTG